MKKRKNFWPWALVNLGIMALVAFALYFTHSLWAFLGLLLMFSIKTKTFDTKCSKCGCEFVAKGKDDDDE